MTKIKDLRTKAESELKIALIDKQEALRKARFAVVSGELTNVREIRILRKDIARIKTLLKQDSPMPVQPIETHENQPAQEK